MSTILDRAEATNNIELEYKYLADHIKLKDFCKVLESINDFQFSRKETVSSWDTYYVKPGQFARHRNSSTPELTIKSKTVSQHSWKRIEVDLKLEVGLDQEENVAQFLNLQGYEKSFSIYKTSVVYYFNKVNYCYYVVYDESLKELGRFIEVEVNKSQVGELNKELSGAEVTLAKAEALLSEIEIYPKNRMRRSLFEIYNKNEVYNGK